MKIFLRILAAIYAFAALRHIANILGFGELPWAEAPLAWQISDVAYTLLDTVAAVGLYQQKRWGVAAFMLAACSEILLFTLVPHWFVLRPEHEGLLQIFVIYHLVALSAWFWLWRRERAQP